MKKMFQKHLARIIIIGMFFALTANMYLQIKMMQREITTESEALFWRINRILTENQEEAETVTKEYQNICLLRARAAAYIIQNKPEVIENLDEMKKIANLLQVDELHIFNKEGVIYAGSEPKYYGYYFDSGKQMRFFLPMLKDKTLALCQPITPNTAENRLMQYAAVWREDGEGIVQIGMKPERVLEVTRKNKLSYIFSLFAEENGSELFVADLDTHKILGSTNESIVGKTLKQIGIDRESIASGERFHEKINGTFSYCIFEEQEDVLVGRICAAKRLYQNLGASTFLVTMYLLMISAIMIWSISKYLDKKIIFGINNMHSKLKKIANGNLDERMEVCTTPEFAELSGYINEMVDSLLEMQKKVERERDEDHLTGLCNRRAFYRQVDALFQRPEDLGYAAFAAIDTDNLKYVNDNYGHDAGDCYLLGMADILRSGTAPNQIVSRLGGDEFEMLIYGCSSREELQSYIEEVRERQGEKTSRLCDKMNIRIEFSMGCAYYGPDGEECQQLLRCADDRMYEEKRKRKQKN